MMDAAFLPIISWIRSAATLNLPAMVMSPPAVMLALPMRRPKAAGRVSMTRSPLAKIELGEATAFLVRFVACILLVTVFVMQTEE
jgi:hypothetical protein